MKTDLQILKATGKIKMPTFDTVSDLVAYLQSDGVSYRKKMILVKAINTQALVLAGYRLR